MAPPSFHPISIGVDSRSSRVQGELFLTLIVADALISLRSLSFFAVALYQRIVAETFTLFSTAMHDAHTL